MDAFLIRKLTVPSPPDQAMGVVASGGIRVLFEDVIRERRVSAGIVKAAIDHEMTELKRKEAMYRGMKPPAELAGHTAIVIDDGLTTGNTMRLAIAALQTAGLERIIAAAPVASKKTRDLLRKEADEVVCASCPEPFYSVDRWYRDYSPIMDRDIRLLLAEADHRMMAGSVH